MARDGQSLLNRVLGGLGFRAQSVSLGPPRDPVIAEWFSQYATTASGVNVTPDNARRSPEVDACVGLIEDTVATIPLDFYERISDSEREARPDHPLHTLLHDRPNGWQTSAEFRQMMEGYRQTHGKACARIVTGLSGPQALEPGHPDEFRPFRTPDGIAFRWSPPDGGPTRILLQSEVLYLRDGPPRRGNLAESIGNVELAREDIGLAMACSEYLSRFFSNNAAPKAAITLPAAISDEAANKLRETWERRHRGLENANRIAILDGAMDIKALGMSNDDAQVVQTHAMAVNKIARRFGVPGFLIGETGDVSNFGTGIEQQSIGFITYYMRPKLVVWEQALNAALMSDAMRRDYYFEFNIDGLLRGDFKTRMEGYALMIQWGLSTPNEIRKLMNLPPIEGGDERLVPLNMAPASRVMDVLLKTAPAGTSQRDQADLAIRALMDILRASGARIPEPTGA
jgi:HK97 family phage portal protein